MTETAYSLQDSHAIVPASSADSRDTEEKAGVVGSSADGLVEEELDSRVFDIELLLDNSSLRSNQSASPPK